MPPADAAPDPLDRPARALAAELMAWCGERHGRDGVWLPAGLWSEWAPWQRDLARRLAAAALAAGREQPDAGGATMTAEGRAAAFARAWGSEGIPRGGLAVALAAAFREAEAAAAGRQRQRFLALIAEARSWWERGNCPEVMETVQAALDQLRLAVMAGQPGDAGGGGSGGA
jgi:hypothetical protein